jgi:2-iminobutanoate/2-iminopropanoate deaminase
MLDLRLRVFAVNKGSNKKLTMKRQFLTLMILLTGIALSAQSLDKTVIYTDKAPKPIGPYSQGIMTGNTLYLSGQIAINPLTGKIDTTSIEKEMRQVLANFGEVLKAAGMSYENVVRTTIYTTDLGNFKTINSIYGEYFKADQPARETVQVVALPGGAHVEISGIAVRKPIVRTLPAGVDIK